MTPEEKQLAVNEAGELTRADLQEILEFYNDKDSAYVNIQNFLEGVTCLTQDQKIAVLNDLESYAY